MAEQASADLAARADGMLEGEPDRAWAGRALWLCRQLVRAGDRRRALFLGAKVMDTPDLPEHGTPLLRQRMVLWSETVARELRAKPSLDAPDVPVTWLVARLLGDAEQVELACTLAERLLDRDDLAARDRLRLHQKLALWTSKNPDRPEDTRHDRALEILKPLLDAVQANEAPAGGRRAAAAPRGDRVARAFEKVREQQRDDGRPAGDAAMAHLAAETWGIAGGIYKRLFEAAGRMEDLRAALNCYLRGHEVGAIVHDDGYNAINAAYVLERLAALETDGGRPAPPADDDADLTRAAALRAEIGKILPQHGVEVWQSQPHTRSLRTRMHWIHVTLAQAWFGQAEYERAEKAFGEAHDANGQGCEPRSWERETTARQFASLAMLQHARLEDAPGLASSPPWRSLRRMYAALPSRAIDAMLAGKLGLALSGGGFRASFFHIGVLAALAERDLLRHVEVCSCVSGGSIVGALYYLILRRRLEAKDSPEPLPKEEYVEMVRTLRDAFFDGVAKDIRGRLGTSLRATAAMIAKPGYTPTERLADLYEEHLYAPFSRSGRSQAAPGEALFMRNLFIRPGDQPDDRFNPKYDNWRRADKVPILVLNATSLNTGHNWQFTASWMGEPPAAIDSEVDGNYRLRRMYLAGEAPGRHKDIRLGQAVAASSCVPGLFPPLELHGLYPGITVRLVDGGVHDNQGVGSLLEQNCSVMVVSDASGQMTAVDDPGDGPIAVAGRTMNMLQARVRVAQFSLLKARASAGLLRGLVFLHLKKDLEVEPRDWVGCDYAKQAGDAPPRTAYGTLRRYQRLLAELRTDLDAFSRAEADSLMESGLRMMRKQLEQQSEVFAGYSSSATADAPARGADPLGLLGDPHTLAGDGRGDDGPQTPHEPLAQQLRVGARRMLKEWKLDPTLRRVGTAVLALVAAAALAGPYWLLDRETAAVVYLCYGLVLAGWLVARALRGIARKSPWHLLYGVVLMLYGTMLGRLHVWLVTPRFTRRSRDEG